jgi:hypothetical protein
MSCEIQVEPLQFSCVHSHKNRAKVMIVERGDPDDDQPMTLDEVEWLMRCVPPPSAPTEMSIEVENDEWEVDVRTEGDEQGFEKDPKPRQTAMGASAQPILHETGWPVYLALLREDSIPCLERPAVNG